MRSCRIVFATFGSLGDLHPYLAIARELRKRGHDPVIATSAVYREKILSDGIGFAAIRPDEHDFGPTEEVFRKANATFRGSEYVVNGMIMPWLRASHDDLHTATEGAHLIVSHCLTFAAPIVAEQRRLPWVGSFLQPIAFLSPTDPPVFAQFPWLTRRYLGRRFYRGLFSTLKFLSKRWFQPIHDLRGDLGLPPLDSHPIFEGQFSPHLNLVLYSSTLARPQPDWPSNAVQTGFPFYDQGSVAHEKLEAGLAHFLDAGEPPVVFTLGSSVVRAAGSFFQESIAAIREFPVRAVLVVGDDPLNRPRATDLRKDIHLVSYVPYRELFSRAKAIVHQGGIGTTGQALRAAVPQLVVPHAHDQPDNAARIVRLGLGLSVQPKNYRGQKVAAMLRQLVQNEAFARRAKEVGAIISDETGAAVAADAIERILGA